MGPDTSIPCSTLIFGKKEEKQILSPPIGSIWDVDFISIRIPMNLALILLFFTICEAL